METLTDNGDGTLTGDLGGSGKINYVTGVWEVEFNTAPAADFTLDYNVFTPDTNIAYELNIGVKDAVGSLTKQVTIPTAVVG